MTYSQVVLLTVEGFLSNIKTTNRLHVIICFELFHANPFYDTSMWTSKHSNCNAFRDQRNYQGKGS